MPLHCCGGSSVGGSGISGSGVGVLGLYARPGVVGVTGALNVLSVKILLIEMSFPIALGSCHQLAFGIALAQLTWSNTVPSWSTNLRVPPVVFGNTSLVVDPLKNILD